MKKIIFIFAILVFAFSGSSQRQPTQTVQVQQEVDAEKKCVVILRVKDDVGNVILSQEI